MSKPKEDAIAHIHFTTGTWIRNNWGLRGHSRLKKYFQTKGVYNPEVMSSIIFGFYYDWLKKENSAWEKWARD